MHHSYLFCRTSLPSSRTSRSLYKAASDQSFKTGVAETRREISIPINAAGTSSVLVTEILWNLASVQRKRRRSEFVLHLCNVLRAYIFYNIYIYIYNTKWWYLPNIECTKNSWKRERLLWERFRASRVSA